MHSFASSEKDTILVDYCLALNCDPGVVTLSRAAYKIHRKNITLLLSKVIFIYGNAQERLPEVRLIVNK